MYPEKSFGNKNIIFVSGWSENKSTKKTHKINIESCWSENPFSSIYWFYFEQAFVRLGWRLCSFTISLLPTVTYSAVCTTFFYVTDFNKPNLQ